MPIYQPLGQPRRFDCLARQARCVQLLAPLAAMFAGSRRLRRIRRNDLPSSTTLVLTRFVGSSCRSAARTSGRGSRFESRCLPHSLRGQLVLQGVGRKPRLAARSFVQTAARAIRLIAPLTRPELGQRS